MFSHLTGRNGDHLLFQAARRLSNFGVRQGSRNGDVISHPGPFAVETLNPVERVMFNPWRKINPFLHLVDGLSILSKVDSVIPLADIADRFYTFSDDGQTLRGHYGARLHEQFSEVVMMLNQEPGNRRAVLSIWEAERDLGIVSRDIPCNLMAVPRIIDDTMHLTVFNRSNDLFWGMLGANIVQFSFLLEYLSASTQTRVGTLTQISTNAHIYTGFGPGKNLQSIPDAVSTEYDTGEVYSTPLATLSPEVTLEDANVLMSLLTARAPINPSQFTSHFFQSVVVPMVHAHREHKKGDTQAVDILPETNNDWIVAARRWLNRRA
jgi:hypothetical protein